MSRVPKVFAVLVLNTVALSVASTADAQQCRPCRGVQARVSGGPPAELYSYGANVDSPGMARVHEMIARVIELETKLREGDANRLRELERNQALGLPAHPCKNSDVPALQEHYEAIIKILELRLEAERREKEVRFEAGQRLKDLEKTQRARLEAEAREEELKEKQRADEAARRVRAYATPRLDSTQFDAATGKIHWPSLLQTQSVFAEDRARIDAFFTQRARGEAPYAAAHCEDAMERMKQKLVTMLGTTGYQDYLDAVKFLASVERELYFPPAAAPPRLAQR
jgi:hypothetical protein